jgi:endonuclease/exonuclease/phosphatase family metal-dependent hydrolase
LAARMKFMSYNLRNGSIREERNTDAWNNWTFRREAVLDVIRTADPDVLALQEDTNEQVSFIQGGLQGAYRVIAEPAFYEADLSNNALLVRDTIEVAGSGAFWISNDGGTQVKPEGSICMRHATLARLTATAGELLVVNVHLDHTRDEAVKRGEMDMFIRLLSGLSGKPPRRTIVMGDFNGVPGLPTYRLLEDFGLRDAARLEGNEQATAVHWGPQPASGRIDYVWLSDDLTNALAGYDVIGGAYQRQGGSAGHASDHSAVFARLDL